MKMHFKGAVIHKNNMNFAIVLVKPNVLNSSYTEPLRRDFSSVFQGLPIVLMAQTVNNTVRYSGRRDFVNYLNSIPLSSISWKSYTLEFHY